jgi:hypothetical protein
MTEEYEAKLVQDIMAMNLDGIETETAEVNTVFKISAHFLLVEID